MQLAIFDVGFQNDANPQKISLYPLNYLPHVMFPVIEALEEAAEALAFLASEVKYRIDQEINWPLLVLVIDNADQLVEMGGEPIREPLTYLLEEASHAGMRVILSVSNPDGRTIGPILKNGMPIRLVGQVADAVAARAITGVPDSQAEYLLGQGDFMAVSNGMLLPFQGAYISDYDLHLILDQLHRQNNPIMIAYPVNVRPSLDDSEEDLEQLQIFQFNSDHRRANLVLPAENESDSEAEEWLEEGGWAEIEVNEDKWTDEEEDYPIDVWITTDRQPADGEEGDDSYEDGIAFDWE
jgi:DNA segregation ATPase FtsK/SpoIIIE-like protein